jgi:RimJ/RimL family protein N-acetyltransferase
MEDVVLQTQRLDLARPSPDQIDALHAMNGDPEVMRFITGNAETRDETLAMVQRMALRWDGWGYGWFQLTLRETGETIGLAGVGHINHDPDQPVEIGWRLQRRAWGKGYASEAAREVLRWAFDEKAFDELLSVANPDNTASTGIMKKLGMRYRGVEQHWQRTCATYVLSRHEYQLTKKAA